jgi:multisubunit Na+/H+ antiporter MnhG subunit
MSRTDEGAATFCKTFGVILLLIGVIGFITPNLFGILPIGGGDIWIHLVTGAILAYAGFAMAPSGSAAATH